MRDAAQARALKLFRMMTVKDFFDKDEIYLSFKDEAGRFIFAKTISFPALTLQLREKPGIQLTHIY